MSGFHKNKPDGSMTELFSFILEQRKTPTPKTRVFTMLLQHSSFYLFTDFTMRLMRCRRAILVCMISGITNDRRWNVAHRIVR